MIKIIIKTIINLFKNDNFKYYPKDSKNVKYIEYKNNVLSVQYYNKEGLFLYRYYKVNSDIVEFLKETIKNKESIGKFLNKNIKTKYNYKCVNKSL